MRVLTKGKINHIKANVKADRDYYKQVEQVKRNAEQEANQEVEPTQRELALLNDMLQELKEWNSITFEYANQIEVLEEARRKDLPKLNQIRKRNERANRKAWEIKKRLNRNLDQYIMFSISTPTDKYGKSEYITYDYKKINDDIQKIIDSVKEAYSEGEQLIKSLTNM